MKPRKNDRVVSPYAGRERIGGGTAPRYGIVRSVSRGVAYVDFSVGSTFLAIPVTELVSTGEHRVWKEMR